MKSLFFALSLAVVAGAAAPQITWAPKSDKGFDQAMESGKFVMQVFVKPRCPECGLLEKSALKDEDVRTLLSERFVAIRSDLARPDGKADAENYGVETFPTILFFNAKGAQIESATLQGTITTEKLLRQLLDIGSDKSGQGGGSSQIQATGQAVQGATPSGSGWSRPDTTARIAPPPLPDTAAPAAP